MTVTIKDVASRAGVSTKTVSRVMNGEAHVRAAVRETVMRVVAELGYRPNAFARSLSSARSYLIGLFFDDPGSGYAVEMQRGALARCRESHYHLMVERLDCTVAGWAEELDATLAGLRLDGVVLTPPLSQEPMLLDRLEAARLPFVCVSPAPGGEPRGWVVDFDERAAAYDMTRHLIALGHRKIGFIEGDPAHASTGSRRAGFVQAMAESDLPIPDGRIRPGDFSFRAGLAQGGALLEHAEPPTAVFASNDDMALGVTVAALQHRIEVPTHLSVAGFDDAPTSRIAWPPITTVHQPMAEMGAAAVACLIAASSPRQLHLPERRIRLPYEIVKRPSTAAT